MNEARQPSNMKLLVKTACAFLQRQAREDGGSISCSLFCMLTLAVIVSSALIRAVIALQHSVSE
jgi:hypothetical protein